MTAIDSLTFGRRLRHYRKRAGLTLQELGEKIQRPAPYLSMLENGRRQPKPEQIADVAAALGVSAEELLASEPPSPRAALEIEFERMQRDRRFEHLDLPYVRASSSLPDEILHHLVGLYRHLTTGGVGDTETDQLRAANAEVGRWLTNQDGYLAEIEAVAGEVLRSVGHSHGPLPSRALLDIAAKLGFEIRAVEDMMPSIRSITDRRSGRIYIAQRNELRTRQARKAILQTLAGRLLGHGSATNTVEYLRQRIETAYLATAILVPEESVLDRLGDAMARRDVSIEDVKEIFYVSYEMAAWRFVNLATRHLGMKTHLIVTGPEGTVLKGYSNDGLPFVRDSAGGVEAQPVCRRSGAMQVFDSEDKFAVHAQYTDTPAGTYFCVTHMEPDRPFAITVGVPFESSPWFRDRNTRRRAESECPDPHCCRLPTAGQLERWGGEIEVSVRTQSQLLGRLASDPYPAGDDRRVYDLVERYSD